MKIKLGIRANSDSVKGIIVWIDDLKLITAHDLFLSGQENRVKTGKALVQLLKVLSKDHEIAFSDEVIPIIEQELHMEEGSLDHFRHDAE